MTNLAEGSAGSRGLWGLLSQGLNSGSNLILAVLVARTSTGADLGGWAIAYAVYVVVLTMSRGGVSTALLLADGQMRERSIAGGLGTALCASVLGAVALSMAALMLGEHGRAALAFALVMPALLAQDYLRFVFIMRMRPAGAALLDGIWVFALVAGALVLSGISAGASTITLVWGLGAASGAVAGLVILQIPRIKSQDIIDFIRRYGPDSGRLVAEAAIVAAGANAAPVVVAMFAGLASAGAFRAAFTVLGVLGIVVSGLTPIATVEAQKWLSRGQGEGRFLGLWIGIVTTFAAVHGVLVLAIPDDIGRELLGGNWNAAKVLFIPLVLQTLLRGPLNGVPILLRVSGRLNKVVLGGFLAMLCTVGGAALGAELGSAEGAAWGLLVGGALADLVYLAIWRFRGCGNTGRPR